MLLYQHRQRGAFEVQTELGSQVQGCSRRKASEARHEPNTLRIQLRDLGCASFAVSLELDVAVPTTSSASALRGATASVALQGNRFGQ